MPVIHASHLCQSYMPFLHASHPCQSSMPIIHASPPCQLSIPVSHASHPCQSSMQFQSIMPHCRGIAVLPFSEDRDCKPFSACFLSIARCLFPCWDCLHANDFHRRILGKNVGLYGQVTKYILEKIFIVKYIQIVGITTGC